MPFSRREHYTTEGLIMKAEEAKAICLKSINHDKVKKLRNVINKRIAECAESDNECTYSIPSNTYTSLEIKAVVKEMCADGYIVNKGTEKFGKTDVLTIEWLID